MRSAEELRFLVLAAQREGNRLLAQSLKPLGVTPSQAEVLRLLQQRQPLTLTGLGALLVCESGSNPSRLVDRLVAAGLVDREGVEQDRRQVQLALTAEGLRIAERVTEIEAGLYGRIDDATAGIDTGPVMGFLRRLVDDSPAGRALEHRKSTGG